jgi:hypothetical protein
MKAGHGPLEFTNGVEVEGVRAADDDVLYACLDESVQVTSLFGDIEEYGAFDRCGITPDSWDRWLLHQRIVGSQAFECKVLTVRSASSRATVSGLAGAIQCSR